jgi:hypothetical protein
VFVFPGPAPPLPLPLLVVVVVVPPPSPTPPVVEVVPEPVGVVALVEVADVEVVVVVGVVVLVDVLVEVDVEVVVVEEVVGVDVAVEICSRQVFRASSAIVLAPWLRFCRNVGLTLTGRVWTSLFNEALALRAAAQLPDCTADEIWSACPLSAIDSLPESRPELPPQATTNEAANPSAQAKMARGA